MSMDLATPAWEACVGLLMPACEAAIRDVMKLLRRLCWEVDMSPLAALAGLIISARVPPEALGSRLSD